MGSAGFKLLRSTSLKKIGRIEGMTQKQASKLREAGMDGAEWERAAKRDLNRIS